MMPKMTGKEVLEKLRANGNTAIIQFVFITAITDRNDKRRAWNLERMII